MEFNNHKYPNRTCKCEITSLMIAFNEQWSFLFYKILNAIPKIALIEF